MFNAKENGKTQAPVQAAINLIANGTSIDGQIQSDGDIRIDGKVTGTVTSKAKIVVGSTGIVNGDLNCENADVSGKVFGKTEVEDLLFLKATGYLEGDIVTNKLVVEAGARFSGTCRMGVKEIKPTSEKANTTPAQRESVAFELS